MRKSLNVASVVVALAMIASACRGPEKGSVEWHKKQYPEARTEGSRHRLALMKLGYLAEKEFTVSNIPAAEVVRVLHDDTFEALSFFDFNAYAHFRAVTTNRVRVVGIPVMVEQWEKRIRELDVPASAE